MFILQWEIHPCFVSSTTPIDWTRVPEATKKYLIKQYGYDWATEEYKPLPATIGDLAKMFDETKFFGYFRSSLLTVLMDISEFGLQPTPQPPAKNGQVCFLLFAPGTREVIVGNSDRIIRNPNDDVDDDDDADADNDDDDGYDEEKKLAAEETAIAQAFDVKLEHEVSRGREEMVDITQKLGGWTASTLQSGFEDAQFAEAIMTLPITHPAHRGLMENVFRDLSSR
ncbi:hypothetical protein M378DRAFT_172856 [Amanita muscaria Koide BX008]|uniref:Uncharacterized protein n=1 Tax=Amanita muscaria (strain Koide BX008) TaxID=946122 RepID=A0A0C2W525_AMAMK|nr:hypothetical protein M378DRAFT_172856 [Amanita muscaria Koide BX008]